MTKPDLLPPGQGRRTRREYNRLYMRLWRARPGNRIKDHVARQEYHQRRKLRIRAATPGPDGLCALCHHRRPLTKIVRLKPVPDGFIEVELPYCGEC